MMKRLLITLLFCFAVLSIFSQRPNRFDPKRYQAELEQFITSEAGLTPNEAAVFFPKYRELQDKQHLLFKKIKRNRRIKPTDEQGCRNAILSRDEADLQIKTLQQQYHKEFLKILSASKLYDVIRAEDIFHRQSFKKWQKGKRNAEH
ncbi:MAG: hypothetical protein PUH24_01815 [Prevotellaceae bacterium]|nr:hypothetical protein [Prevotella sp.]MDD7257015.1 hypothetical protein [Prevotellaceae bacterium]MDY6130215.1 hypothetical protein [Prevotella sp.]